MTKKKNNKKYRAFISYRHADNKQEGRQWATWLHQAIETYEVPDDLAGTKNGHGETIPARIYPIFRDEEELPADADLGDAIVRALDVTQVLIVLCSPNAVESTYVDLEIDYFKKIGGSSRIIAALIKGEPNTSWDKGKQAKGFTKEEECFPTSLQFRYDKHGNKTDKRAEPIAADFRIHVHGKPVEGWTTPEAYREYLKQAGDLNSKAIKEAIQKYEQQQKLMLLKIIAGILGVPLGELTERDKAYQLKLEQKKSRRLKQWLTAVIALAVISIFSGMFAWNQKINADEKTQIAIERRNESLINQSQFLMAKADARVGGSENEIALLLGLNAMPGIYGGERPTPKNVAPLYRAVIEAKQKLTTRKIDFKHKESVNQAQYSPDGKLIITSSDDDFLIVWSAETGKKIKQLQTYGSKGVFSPDNQYLAVPDSSGKQVYLYSTKNWEHLHTLEIYPYGRMISITNLQFSHDSQFLAIGSSSYSQGLLTHWSVGNGKLIFKKEKESREDPTYLEFTPDDKELLVVYNNEFEMWTIESQAIRYTKKVSGNSYGADLSPNGKYIAILSDEAAITVWSADDGKKIASSTDAVKGYFLSDFLIQFSPDNNSILTIEGENWAGLWSTKSAKLLKRLYHEAELTFADFNRNGTLILTTSEDKTAKIWSAENGNLLKTINHKDKVLHGSFDPNGEYFLTASRDTTGALWQLTDPGKDNFVHENKVETFAISNDGNQLLSIDSKNNVYLWSITDNRLLGKLDGKFNFYDAVFSQDGQHLVLKAHDKPSAISEIDNLNNLSQITGPNINAFNKNCDMYSTISDDKIVELWSLKSGSKIATFEHDFKVINTLFSPDDDKLLVETVDWENRIVKEEGVYNVRTKIVLWSTKSTDRINDFEIYDTGATEVRNIKFSSDSRKLLVRKFNGDLKEYYGSLSIYSTSGKLLHDMVVDLSQSTINDEALSYNNKLVAIIRSYTDDEGHRRGDITLWSVDSGQKIKHLKLENSGSKILFSQNGKMFACISEKKALVWLTSNGILLQSIDLKSDDSLMSFSADDKSLIISSDNSIESFPLIALDELTKTALAVLPKNRRCLTPEERAKFYLPKLSNKQWIERGCPQFTKENIASRKQQEEKDKQQQGLIESLINWSKMDED